MNAKNVISDLVTEALGTLSEIPKAWIKHFTNANAGENSELKTIQLRVPGIRKLADIIKGQQDKFAGVFLKDSETGKPVGIVKFKGEGAKPWRFFTPEGDYYKEKDYKTRAARSWERKPVTYDDPKSPTGKSSYVPRFQTISYHEERTDMPLNDISHLLPKVVDVYGLTRDANRAQVQADRQATRSGVGVSSNRGTTPSSADLSQIRSGAAQKFLAAKTGEPLSRLKQEITAMTDKVKANLEKAVADAEAGKDSSYSYRSGVQVMSDTELRNLNSMLYDLRGLNQQVNAMTKKGGDVANRAGGWEGSRMRPSWDYKDLQSKLVNIKKRFDQLQNSGRYESLARKALATLLK